MKNRLVKEKSMRNLTTNATRKEKALDAITNSKPNDHDEYATNHPATLSGLPDTGERQGADAKRAQVAGPLSAARLAGPARPATKRSPGHPADARRLLVVRHD